MVPGEVHTMTVLPHFISRVPRRVLRGDDHLIAIAPFLHPLADPRLALLILVVVGGVDEVAACFGEGVEEGEGLLFVHAAHAAFPGFANGHGAELEGGDAHAGGGGEDADTAELGGGLGRGLEEFLHGRWWGYVRSSLFTKGYAEVYGGDVGCCLHSEQSICQIVLPLPSPMGDIFPYNFKQRTHRRRPRLAVAVVTAISLIVHAGNGDKVKKLWSAC